MMKDLKFFDFNIQIKLDETVPDGYVYLEDKNGNIILKEKLPNVDNGYSMELSDEEVQKTKLLLAAKNIDRSAYRSG